MFCSVMAVKLHKTVRINAMLRTEEIGRYDSRLHYNMLVSVHVHVAVFPGHTVGGSANVHVDG